jgi:nicotinamidase/pyrazinamidase
VLSTHLATTSANVDKLYEPDLQKAYEAGLQAFRRPASDDSKRVLLWLVDVQVDFVFPPPIGRLSVPGAVDDTRRLIEFIDRNVQHITQISASLDTHTPFQIFFPTWWRNKDGQHPAPYTVITSADVERGVWQPVIESAWSVYYVEQLERIGKKQLMIWPFHCMEGTNGRALVPALSEAIMYHSAARMSQPIYLPKGTIAQTEYYSIIEPEVKYDRLPEGGANLSYLETVVGFDLIYVAGQARSHCVLETMNSVLRYYGDEPEVLSKFRFLDDCSSCISGFEASTQDAMMGFEALGVQFVNSFEEVH